MLYALKIHKTQYVFAVRPKEHLARPITLTFQKPIDAALLYSEINERSFKVHLSDKKKLIFKVNQTEYHPNFQLDNWCTQIDTHMIKTISRGMGHDIFIVEDIDISDKVILIGHVSE